MAYELFKRNVRHLVHMFRFACGVIIDRNQLMHSEKLQNAGNGATEWVSVILDLKNV